VSEVEPRLFSGELRYELATQGTPDDGPILAALEARARSTSSTRCRTASTPRRGAWSQLLGGQRQRLSLARALLTETDLLILVEPTSAVDTHTEGRIAARLANVRRGRTTLIATTSPLVLERMDRVFVVVAGHVVDQGSHESLLATSKTYRQIVLREESP